MLVTAMQAPSRIGHRRQASKTYSVTFVHGPSPAAITERNWETALIGDQCPVAAAFPVDAQKKKPSPRPHVAVDRSLCLASSTGRNVPRRSPPERKTGCIHSFLFETRPHVARCRHIPSARRSLSTSGER